MAYFRMSDDAKSWFKGLGFELDFDGYYLCLMIGLAKRRKEDVVSSRTGDLVDYFPGRYRDTGRLIVALFLIPELEALGISMGDRKDVHGAITRYLDHLAPNHLSADGTKEMNRYAAGGFDVLSDSFEDRPRDPGTFFIRYKRLIDQTLAPLEITDTPF